MADNNNNNSSYELVFKKKEKIVNEFQIIIANWNDDAIRCMCPRCTEYTCGNYPITENNHVQINGVYYSRPTPESIIGLQIGFPSEQQVSLTIDCALWYSFIQECCYQSIELPKFEDNHPSQFVSFNFGYCLSSWLNIVKGNEGLYRMLHKMTLCSHFASDRIDDFDEWIKTY